MKHVKLFEDFENIDPFGEEDWDEVEPDGTFLYWLKQNHPDETNWNRIKTINCSNNQLTDLKGIENLRNLRELYCFNNQLTDLKGIENLRSLKILYCSYNQLTDLKEIENLRNLRYLHCNNNQLTDLEGIENLRNLRYLWCSGNQFSNEYKEYLREYCRENKIDFRI